MKQNDAEPQRESRSVEDKKKLTKGAQEKKEKNVVCRNPGLPRLLRERRRREKRKRREERERPSNQSQWTRWREREDYQNRAFRSSSRLDICCFSVSFLSFLSFRFSLFLFFS